MKKTYKSKLHLNNFLVNYNGEIIRVEMNPDVISKYGLRGCSFTTEDVELQKAIEAHPGFNNGREDGFWTEDVEDNSFADAVDEMSIPASLIEEAASLTEEPAPKKKTRQKKG